MDIRRKTCLIIRKNGEYLVGFNVMTLDLNWSQSCYDAWRTRDKEKARAIAQRCGGTLMLFNPVAGQLKVY